MMPRRRRLLQAGAGGALAVVLGATALSFFEPLMDRQPSQRSAAPSSPLEAIAALSTEGEFQRPAGPWQLSLPDDHGAHPTARVETWMLAAQLEDQHGEAIGMHFSLARFGLRKEVTEPNANPWNLRSLYRAHFVAMREDETAALAEERFSRGAGAAGHDHVTREVWLDHWKLDYGLGQQAEQMTLSASAGDLLAQLTLTPVKSAVQSDAGETSPARGFSIPRMKVDGVIEQGAARTKVSGLAWLDRLWGELPLPGGPLAYDRMVVQLDNGTDLSLLRSRRRGKPAAATIDGFIAQAAGGIVVVTDDLLEMVPTAHRRSAGTEADYPIAWRITGPHMDLKITAYIEEPAKDFAFPAWIGALQVEGTHEGATVSGRGTLQMTGYEDP